jgi:electron transfer flavoprotein-quinone oxidoreductase
VIVVGGGPAGLAAAMTLARRGFPDVIVLERGTACGAKNVMGGILFTPSLERLIPRIWETDAPLERPVTRRTFSLLSADSSADFSFRAGSFARPPHNHSFTVLRGKFDRWLAGRAAAAGVTILTGVTVDGLLRDDRGRVTGVRTRVEEGTDPAEGHLEARLVILAEGANALIAEREGLRPKILPHDAAVAVKEVISLPEERIRDRFSLGEGDGEGREYYGEAAGGMFGSGFIYTNRESLSVGVAVSVRDLSARGITPNDLLERFKAHPSVAPLLAGGETLEYSAHLIPEGGYHRLGRLCDDGLLVVGDAAGLVNVSPYHEGANLAIASGIMAAETALEALTAGDTGAEALAAYRRRLEESFVLKDMEKYADLPGFLKENPQLLAAWPATLLSALQDLFTVSEEPKAALEARATGRIMREIGLVPLGMTLWGLRGATRSLFYDATEKAVDYLRRNW